jgi:hypothetical protein
MAMRRYFYETKDRTAGQFLCFDCAAPYVLTAEQQDWFHAKGYPLPKRCEGCRAAKRERNTRRASGEDAAA